MQYNPPIKLTNKPVYYVANKSGGHIIPCLTLAQEIRRANPLIQQYFITSGDTFDRELIDRSRSIDYYVHITIPEQLPTTWFTYISFMWQMSRTILSLAYKFLKKRPQYVVCTGGMIAIPVAIAARLLAIQVRWYELNVEPGRATLFITRWWRVKLYTCFDKTATYLQRPVTKTAYPVRFSKQRQRTQAEALDILKLSKERATICVLGGSQGSTFINNALLSMLERHPELYPNIQLLHQTGIPQIAECTKFYVHHKIPATVCAFNPAIDLFYAAADVIICRAGAGTLFEVLFFKKPCITIPLNSGINQHQIANAQQMQAEHPELFQMMSQEEITADADALYNALFKHLQHKLTKPSYTEDTHTTTIH